MPSRLHDPLLVLASFAVVAVLVLVARAALRRWPDSRFATRKLLHLAVGGWTVVATALFDRVGWALVPPAAFLITNLTGRPRIAALNLARDRREALGLWLFPAGVILLYVAFWDDAHRGAVVAGAAALAVADPAAAAIGSRYGQRRFRGFGFGRSLEGSLIFLLLAGFVTAGVAAWTGEARTALRIGVGCGIAGTLAELVAPAGFDNLTVPIAVAAAYTALT